MLLHLLFVPHATCEHGELVEGARPRAEASSPVKPGEAQIAASHEADGHDHCDALALRHRIPEVGPSVAAASLVEITLIDEGGERAGMRPLPILSLAPKGSPPV